MSYFPAQIEQNLVVELKMFISYLPSVIRVVRHGNGEPTIRPECSNFNHPNVFGN